MPGGNKVPVHTLERLATYLSILTDMKGRHIETISSTDIEERTGINAAQFRKDLSYFGEFGKPGIGYNVPDLQARIARILNLDKTQKVILVGVGNLGSALLGYPALRAENFEIVAAFDANPAKVGRKIWDLTIMDIASLTEENARLQAKIAIIAVPAPAAQEVAEKLADASIRTILNFAPVVLRLPRDIQTRNVDFVQELAVLSFHVGAQKSDNEKEVDNS
jgi:redox-sensing transcriptional repressor